MNTNKSAAISMQKMRNGISIIDVIDILTGTDRSRKYWNDLKTKLKKEGRELSEKVGHIKIQLKRC